MSSSSSSVLILGHGLSLVPRLRMLLSFTPSDLSVRPIDDWQLKESIQAFMKDAFSIVIAHSDLSVHKHRDLHKRRRGDPVASGILYIWDVHAIKGGAPFEKNAEDVHRFLHQKGSFIISKLSGVELNIGGLKLRCHVLMEDADSFDSIQRSWQKRQTEVQVGKNIKLPDTLILRGIPARWLAEPRISPKASVLVTHTIFSHFGVIRNLDIQEEDTGSIAQGLDKGIAKAFSCQIWVQFQQHSSFYNAIRSFCSHSMIREGSSFKANYDLSWDNNGYFTQANIRMRKFEKERVEELRQRQLIMEARQAEIASRQAELAKTEHAKLERERSERDRLEKQQQEEERLEQERQEKERLEKERQDQLGREREEKERLKREERARLERERKEREQLERERREKEQLAREFEQEKLEREGECLREEERCKQKRDLALAKEEEMRRQKEQEAMKEMTSMCLAPMFQQEALQKEEHKQDRPYKQSQDGYKDTGQRGQHGNRDKFHMENSGGSDMGRWLLDGAAHGDTIWHHVGPDVNFSKRLRSIIVDPKMANPRS